LCAKNTKNEQGDNGLKKKKNLPAVTNLHPKKTGRKWCLCAFVSSEKFSD